MRGAGNYFWSGLDLLTFFRNLLHITLTIEMGLEGLSNLGVFNVITQDLLIISLLFSAYFTYKRKKLGFWIYVAQLPLRVYCFMFSFTFLFDLPITYVFENGLQVLTILVLSLELFRIWYWVKNYNDNFPKLGSDKRADGILDDRL